MNITWILPLEANEHLLLDWHKIPKFNSSNNPTSLFSQYNKSSSSKVQGLQLRRIITYYLGIQFLPISHILESSLLSIHNFRSSISPLFTLRYGEEPRQLNYFFPVEPLIYLSIYLLGYEDLCVEYFLGYSKLVLVGVFLERFLNFRFELRSAIWKVFFFPPHNNNANPDCLSSISLEKISPDGHRLILLKFHPAQPGLSFDQTLLKH